MVGLSIWIVQVPACLHLVRDMALHSEASAGAVLNYLAGTTEAGEVGALRAFAGGRRAFQVGKYYTHDVAFSTGTRTAPTVADRLYAVRFEVSRPISIDQWGVGIQSLSTGGVIRFGIYRDASGEPGDLLVDAGTVSNGAGAVSPITGPISPTLPLPAGTYWFAYVSQSATVQGNLYVSDASDPTIATTLPTNEPYKGYQVSGVTGALATTYSWTPSTQSAATARISVRVASVG